MDGCERVRPACPVHPRRPPKAAASTQLACTYMTRVLFWRRVVRWPCGLGGRCSTMFEDVRWCSTTP